jgi:hypothetical protein
MMFHDCPKSLAEVIEAHTKRWDVPPHELQRRPKRVKCRPNTVLIWEAYETIRDVRQLG